MGEIIDTSLTASDWSDRHGNAHQLGEIQVDDDEVVSGDALDDGEPSEEDFEDYTGNAGMTLERWYHRAAIVIWPRDRHFAVLCGAGTEAAVGGLEAMVKATEAGLEGAAGGDATATACSLPEPSSTAGSRRAPGGPATTTSSIGASSRSSSAGWTMPD